MTPYRDAVARFSSTLELGDAEPAVAGGDALERRAVGGYLGPSRSFLNARYSHAAFPGRRSGLEEIGPSLLLRDKSAIAPMQRKELAWSSAVRRLT